MRIVGMIPARLGSKRVKSKNLRLLDGKPLIEHMIEAASSVDEFDDVWVNSDGEIFELLAQKHGLNFYKRPPELANDSATNDDFALDFINQVGGDILIQMLPTSPFIDSAMIAGFIKEMIITDVDTLVSVADVRIECMFDGQPINFDQKAPTPPSQLLTPIKAYACGLMGWRVDRFKQNIETLGSAYHGGNGKIGYCTISGLGTVDIDEEHDFMVAEALFQSKKQANPVVNYYEGE